MRAVRYHEHGDQTVLSVDEVERPEPAQEEVLVDVRAAGINPIDTYIMAGNVSPTYGLPGQAGSDLAGVVTKCGPGVSEFEEGDRVFATALGLFQPGSLADYVTVSSELLGHLPDSVSFSEGAAAAMGFVTAWYGLVDRGQLQIGETCLVAGASGTVGHAGVQIGRAAGATVVGLASNDAREFVEELGADVVIDYRTEDLEGTLVEAVGGIDVALESHADANLHAEIKAANRGGRIVIIGEEGNLTLDPGIAMTAKQADLDIRFMSIAASTSVQQRILNKIGLLLADGTFETRIDSRFDLEETVNAYEYLIESDSRGSVVVELD